MDETQKQELKEGFTAPMLSCPECGWGSGELLIKALREESEWGQVECLSCEEKFEIGEAIDQMFLDGRVWGYGLWAGHKVVPTVHEVDPGEVSIEEIRGEFESSYDIANIQWGAIDGGTWLAGGAVAKYVPQGYMMMALAPSPGGGRDREQVFLVRAVGRAPDAPGLPPWKETLLEGRILGEKAPAMAPIMAVAALDLFVESFADAEDYALQDEDEPRPGCWRTALKRFARINLKTLLGGSLRRPQKLAELRNKLAHGRDYLPVLPEPVRGEEEDWQDRKYQYPKDSRLTPAGEFSMRIALEVIRSCRRELVA